MNELIKLLIDNLSLQKMGINFEIAQKRNGYLKFNIHHPLSCSKQKPFDFSESNQHWFRYHHIARYRLSQNITNCYLFIIHCFRIPMCFDLTHTKSQILQYKDYFLIIEVWAPHQYSANQFWISTSDRKRPKCRRGKQKEERWYQDQKFSYQITKSLKGIKRQ